MNVFDWVVTGLVVTALVVWGALALLAKSMSDEP